MNLKTTEIRRMAEDDVGQVVHMIHSTMREAWGNVYSPDLVKQFCFKYTPESMIERMREIDYWVAEVGDGSVVGVIGLKGNQLRTFFVELQYQGKGVGRKLYDMLEATASERGLEKLVLEGSPWGQPIYKAFGFKQVGSRVKRRSGVNYDDALMEKQLIERG
jgi:GNAT superfamily N-acetyltransferase